MKVAIIIPAHNEEKRIGKTLETYTRFFGEKSNTDKFDYEIIVVINNTKDNTENVVKKFSKENKKIVCLNFKQGGKGFAVTEGFKNALKKKNDLIGFVDADMATPPEEYYKLIQKIGKFDGIIGNRWSKSSLIIKKQSLLRRVASRLFNFLVRIFFFVDYQDTQCGAKLFKIDAVRSLIPKIFITQWAFDVNLLYVCKIEKISIKEEPVKWEDKDFSKLNILRASLKMFLGILRLRIIYSPLNKIIRFYDALPEYLKIA